MARNGVASAPAGGQPGAPFECGEREVKIKNRGYTINVAATH